MSWKVGAAKQRFSELLRRAAEAPQPIHNRETLVATVIGPEDSRLFLEWRNERKAPMTESLREARRICVEEDYELVAPPRVDRGNALLMVSDARRHQRRK
jgi:antitoxin (DNA-binding transcriptional repressor) of toxin-antitoxin stability system